MEKSTYNKRFQQKSYGSNIDRGNSLQNKQTPNSNLPNIGASHQRSIVKSGTNLANNIINKNTNINNQNIQNMKQYQNQDEIQSLKLEINQMKQQIVLKDQIVKEYEQKLQLYRQDMTKLRKENFELKSRITQLEDKVQEEKIEPRKSKFVEEKQKEVEDIRALQIALQFDEQEKRQKDREMIMGFIMHNQFTQMHMVDEEEKMLQKAIEESQKNNPNPDNMTYEQLMDLEDKMGKVSKGLSKDQIHKLPAKFWREGITQSQQCSICQDDFYLNQKYRILQMCGHEYHDSCIQKWLQSEKRCPVCNKDVV